MVGESRKYIHKNPFVNYLSEFRAASENKKVFPREVFKTAGNKWRQMSDPEKEPYVKAAKNVQLTEKRMKKDKRIKRAPKGKVQKISQSLKIKCSRCGHKPITKKLMKGFRKPWRVNSVSPCPTFKSTKMARSTTKSRSNTRSTSGASSRSRGSVSTVSASDSTTSYSTATSTNSVVKPKKKLGRPSTKHSPNYM